MQRWILLSVVLFLGLLAGSTLVGYRIYKLNRPHPVWVPLPINPELPGEKKAEIAADLKTKLGTQADHIDGGAFEPESDCGGGNLGR